MAWPRRKPRPPKVLFPATKRICELERSMVYRTVKVDFTMDNVARMMYGDELVDLLRAAYPHLTYCGMFASRTINLPGYSGELRLDFTRYGMGAPKVYSTITSCSEPMKVAFAAIGSIVEKFDCVRRVVSWLNESRVTPRTARFYCPWLCSLLPPEHLVNQTDGLRHSSLDMSEISNDIREAGTIVASGLLCLTGDANKSDEAQLSVSVNGSQSFHLL